MNELSKLLQENLNIEFISATLSNPKKKDDVQKVKIRPVLKKEVLYFQFESFRNNQAFHENVEEKKACEILLEYMGNMRQMQMETQRADYTVLVSKKGKVTIKSKIKKGGKKKIDMSHDRKKKYVLEEGVPVPFLQDLGVMTQDGKIVRAKSDKFRQINRFLECEGYEAQILEFIDMEHTPKNILIRAVKRNQKADQKESVRRQQIEASIRKCEAELRVSPTLGRLLDNQGKTE